MPGSLIESVDSKRLQNLQVCNSTCAKIAEVSFQQQHETWRSGLQASGWGQVVERIGCLTTTQRMYWDCCLKRTGKKGYFALIHLLEMTLKAHKSSSCHYTYTLCTSLE